MHVRLRPLFLQISCTLSGEFIEYRGAILAIFYEALVVHPLVYFLLGSGSHFLFLFLFFAFGKELTHFLTSLVFSLDEILFFAELDPFVVLDLGVKLLLFFLFLFVVFFL